MNASDHIQYIKQIEFLEDLLNNATDKELRRTALFEYDSKTTIEILHKEMKNRGILIRKPQSYNDEYLLQIEENRYICDMFENVSIRGRFAFGLTCLEQLLEQYDLAQYGSLNDLIQLFWSYTSSDRLDIWEDAVWNVITDSSDFWDFAEKFNFCHVDMGTQYFITALIKNIFDLGCGNLYAGYQNYLTMTYLLRLIENMRNRNLPVPDSTPFQKSLASEYHGWGNAVDPSFFKAK